MRPQDFLKEAERFCNSFDKRETEYGKGSCNGCPFADEICPNDIDISTERFAKMYDVVSEWSDNHPIKTRQSEFLKLFPNASIRNGVISLCPKFYCLNFLGTDLPTCEATKCNKCMRDYWLSPIDESEATE